MKQQVNLYQPIFRRQRPMFSARFMGQALVLMVLTLAGVYGFAWYGVETLRARVDGLQSQRSDAESRLLSLEQSLPRREPSRLLAAEVQRLQIEVAERAALVNMLSVRSDTSDDGFSAHLEGLARQHVRGLWLTGLRLSDGGRDVVLRGSALDAALVPVLVQRLADEPAFSGMRFAALTIDRSSASPERVDFVLRTRSEDEEAKADGRR